MFFIDLSQIALALNSYNAFLLRKEIRVEKIIVHEGWGLDEEKGNDIALLRLGNVFMLYLSPVLVPKSRVSFET